MEPYYKFTGNDYKFIPLFSCFENICSCSMGLCFPYCLFGKIYEKAKFGKCWVGCIKLLSLQILRYNFLIHFIPCTNQCALCQEYNTIEMIEAIRPIEPIQKFNYDI